MDNGLTITKSENEILIKGTKEELLELAEYIKNVANSKLEKDHIHIDELSLLKKDSEIKELIIEKE